MLTRLWNNYNFYTMLMVMKIGKIDLRNCLTSSTTVEIQTLRPNHSPKRNAHISALQDIQTVPQKL